MNATIEAAHRNRAARLAALARLRPVYAASQQAEKAIEAAKAGAGEIRTGFQLMQSLKHIPGFFPTPPAIVGEMLDRAGNVSGKTVLEPSAGKGNIAEDVRKAGGVVSCIEKVFALAEHLRKLGFDTACWDFMDRQPAELFDLVLMNPPFENRQDVAHVQHAFEFLKPGGRLVAIASSTGAARLEQWATDRDGYVEPLPAKAFETSERPTGVNCAWVIAEN